LSYGDAMHPSAVTFNPATGKSYTYDANGNMLTRGSQTLTWDIDNRVTSASITGGGTTFMEYDYTGMRVKKNAPTGITLFPFKGVEIDPNGVITKFIKIGIESFAAKKGGEKFFYHNDHLGGVNVITDSAGARVRLNEYDPWGAVSRTEGTIDPTHRFTGQELDPETGLYYYGGRYYDQEINRFISPDPFVQAPENPQNLNRYSYVLNNPVNLVDPNGHFFWVIIVAVFFIGGIFGSDVADDVFIPTLDPVELIGRVILHVAAALLNQPETLLKAAELKREVAKQQPQHTQQLLPEVRRDGILSKNSRN